MANYRDFYRTPLLSAKNLKEKGNKLVGVIESIQPETIKDGKGKESVKLVIEMDDGDVRISLNKTNVVALASVLGDDFEKWVGAKIEVTTKPTTYMGENTLGLSITAKKTK